MYFVQLAFKTFPCLKAFRTSLFFTFTKESKKNKLVKKMFNYRYVDYINWREIFYLGFNLKLAHLHIDKQFCGVIPNSLNNNTIHT